MPPSLPGRLVPLPRAAEYAQRMNNRFRPSRSPRPCKQLHFDNDEDAAFCHRIEAMAQLRRIRMNDYLVHLLKVGVQHDKTEPPAANKP